MTAGRKRAIILSALCVAGATGGWFLRDWSESQAARSSASTGKGNSAGIDIPAGDITSNDQAQLDADLNAQAKYEARQAEREERRAQRKAEREQERSEHDLRTEMRRQWYQDAPERQQKIREQIRENPPNMEELEMMKELHPGRPARNKDRKRDRK